MSPMERIVVVLWIPEPVALINKVRQRLPQTEVTYAQVGDVVAFSSKGTGIPQGMYPQHHGRGEVSSMWYRMDIWRGRRFCAKAG